MKAIVGVDESWGIGKGQELLYHIPGDMKFFKEKTVGNVVVMGKNTFLSFPRQEPLRDRVNIVLTRDKTFQRDGVITCGSKEELLKKIKDYPENSVYVIGGDSVYKQLLEYCDTVYVTKFLDKKEADKFFPNLDEDDRFILSSEGEEREEKGIKYKFCTYCRI